MEGFFHGWVSVAELSVEEIGVDEVDAVGDFAEE